jgi:uncharacterized protein YndB with AHSA1/START domain
MKKITVETEVHAPIEKVWQYWSEPDHIVNWAFASDDWECPSAENDLQTGGKFKSVMAAKDGSSSFDFEGVYTHVKEFQLIEYTMSDGRTVKVEFHSNPHGTKIIETFETESENSEEQQRHGWQTILDNFKKYTEEN